MPAPALIAAGQLARQVVLRRLLRLSLALLPVLLIGAAAVGVIAVLVISTSDTDSGSTTFNNECSTVAADGPAQVAGLTAAQLANAQTMVAVGRQLDVPPYGWVVAVATAMQESSLTNLTSGHLDSVGLLQQQASWGSTQDRLDPQTSARMFYTGGRQGQQGLTRIPGFESLPLTRAAQAVQHSAFPDAYAHWEGLARQIVSAPAVLSASCYTTAEYRGDGSPGAHAVASALQFLGTPYSWGGGGIGGPGKGFGPGANTIGFDCSSLVQYAYHRATGLSLPRVTDAQAAALPHVPPGSELKAGDLLFFHSPGDPAGSYHHVGIYDGQGGMVHAPRTGKTVEVVHKVLSHPYSEDQLALVARPAQAGPVQAGDSHG